MIYCVIKKYEEVDYRVHPIGSESWINETFLGAFLNKEDAINFNWNYVDSYIKESSLTISVRAEKNKIILEYLDSDKIEFCIIEVEVNDFINYIYYKFSS